MRVSFEAPDGISFPERAPSLLAFTIRRKIHFGIGQHGLDGSLLRIGDEDHPEIEYKKAFEGFHLFGKAVDVIAPEVHVPEPGELADGSRNGSELILVHIQVNEVAEFADLGRK